MKLLRTLDKIIVEGAMKRAMEDMIEKAAKHVPHGTDDDKYIMAVVAKCLELDHGHLFHGDAVECEAMVRGTLGLSEAADQPGRYEPSEKELGKLIDRLDADARGPEKILANECRYKDVVVHFKEKVIEWITQESSAAESKEGAKAISKELTKAGFHGFTVCVCVRDDYRGAATPWQKSKSR